MPDGTKGNPLYTTSDNQTNGTQKVQSTIIANTKVADTGNSSTTPLAEDAVFTGVSLDVSDYVQILVSVYSDKASAANGMSAQFSSDNVNWVKAKAKNYLQDKAVKEIVVGDITLS